MNQAIRITFERVQMCNLAEKDLKIDTANVVKI
jgi:hypothetical protein